MKILAIESSCDDTAAAVTEGRKVLSTAVASQIMTHRVFGGVVPEIASRQHTESICAVTEKALSSAGLTIDGIDAVAVTAYPGLIGSLLVGVNFAKGLCLSSNKPLCGVHHLRSHIAANYITHADLEPPFLCLVVSGGNTQIVAVDDYTKFRVLGKTRDDAAGECFDKTARAMGMSYPGGVELDIVAEKGDPSKYKLPTPSVDGSVFDFSFSGLKTAVINTIHNAAQKNQSYSKEDLSAAVRQKVCDICVEKTMLCAEKEGFDKIAVAGGVSANSLLRRKLLEGCEKSGKRLFLPELKYCGDNAAMVGVQGYYELLAGNRADMGLNAAATKNIED